MSNLKVNAKSSVLEHKRKHNLLVDEFEKVPELVDTKIASDKEIISKIVNDTEESFISFPKNIAPLMYYNAYIDEYYFFDYYNEQLVDSNGDILAPISVSNGKVEISSLQIEEINENYDCLVYVIMENNDDITLRLNSYNLFKDIPTTQLYKHTITNVYEDNEADGQGTLEIISTISTPVSNSLTLIGLMNSAIKITPIDVNGDFADMALVFNASCGIWQDNYTYDYAFRFQEISVDRVEKI